MRFLQLLFVCVFVGRLLNGNELTTDQPPASGKENQNLLEQALNFAKGHQEFRDLYFKQHEQEFVRLVEEGQSPQTLFIACSIVL